MKKSDAPRIIALSGASGSGKTTIARALAASFELDQSYILSLDHFYRDLSHLAPQERAQQDFDHPDSIEHSALHHVLSCLKEGKSAQIPQYDFEVHTRKKETLEIAPHPLIIVEGIFALSYPEIRGLLDLKVFVTCPDSVYLPRRIQRDMQERGRTRACILDQYYKTVLPAFKTHIEPQAGYADFTTDGTQAVEVSVETIRRSLAD